MLKVKKIYIDSRFKTEDSKSHTDFAYDIGTTCFMEDGTSYYMDDVNIPNSWYSVEQGVNSKLYIRFVFEADIYKNADYIIDVPSDVYDGDTFTNILKILVSHIADTFLTIVYDPNRNRLCITCSGSITQFRIMTDKDLRDPATQWGKDNASIDMPNVTITDYDNLGSINEVIKNYGRSITYTRGVTYYSGYLDFLRYNNIYISGNIGEYQTIGPKGQMTIIRKVPVTAGSGFVKNDRVVNKHDLLGGDKTTLRTIHFTFHDAWGKIINLNGGHVSLSLVFTNTPQD